MSLAQSQIIHRPERRRSERVPRTLPLVVRGVSLDTKPFQEDAFTISVSAHGALVGLATTVTLGQALFLRNPHTQEEVGAWVTRFGPPRGGLAQVGVELVHPDSDFWVNGPRLRPATEDVERRIGQQMYVVPDPSESSPSEQASPVRAVETPQPTIVPSRPGPPSEANDGLLQALGQTLQQAAEQVVASASSTRLNAAVNQAAEAIENFGNSRIRQLEERLVQYREEFVVSAREEFLTRLKADIEQTEERLQSRAAAVVEERATKAHGEFSGKIEQTAGETAAAFGEQAAGISTQHAAQLAEQARVAMSDVRSRIDTASAELAEAQDKIKAETDRAIGEAQQRMDLLASQCKEVYAACETRLQAFQEELTHSSGQEVEVFRERLRGILNTLLSSLG